MDRIFSEKLVVTVDSSDLETFILDYLGENPLLKDYEILADLEASNDSVHEFTVSANEHSSVEQVYEEFWGSNVTGGLLNILCREGLIKEGTYLVGVSW